MARIKQTQYIGNIKVNCLVCHVSASFLKYFIQIYLMKLGAIKSWTTDAGNCKINSKFGIW